ncbi:GNAT family N-acetyltransferase [Actinomycetes bacterium KLBMP 9797]
MITEATADDERREVQVLFESVFGDIDAHAVPPTRSDHLYAPLVLRYHDPDTGTLAGALLACRAQIAVSAQMIGGRLPGGPDYRGVLDKHRELDLMAVTPPFRSRGIGSALLTTARELLAARGVRVWFGNATEDLNVERLRHFYTTHGFTVLHPGQSLPPLLGRQWTMPNVHPKPAFYFYGRLVGTGASTAPTGPA